jgi:hypothetical protein
MIYAHKHRIVDEIERQAAKGQNIHFLTGDGINDNFFYDIYCGAMSLSDTLALHYLVREQSFDYYIHVCNGKDHLKCFRQGRNEAEEIPFEEMLEPPKLSGVFANAKKKPPVEESQGRAGNDIQNAAEDARAQADSTTARIQRLNGLLKQGEKRILLFLENLDWISNLYGDSVDNTWIGELRSWERMRNLRVIITLKDMELLERYRFEQKEIFVASPSAEEIRMAYLRYLLRTTDDAYRMDWNALDEVAHSMAVGKKSLCACMRVLRDVVRKNPQALVTEDFSDGAERSISEVVSWQEVRLDNGTKSAIEEAVDVFLSESDGHQARKGILLTGPPGTGKTMIAKALANEKKCHFMAPTLADLKGEYVGQSSGKVKRVFAEARGNAPTILFIDEADTVFPARDMGGIGNDSFGLDMVNQFLQELDGAMTGTQKIFTIAATNRPEAIDPAIKSRLSGQPILVPLPDKAMRKLIFSDQLMKGDIKYDLGGTLEDFVLSRSEGMSGRDVSNFVKKIKENIVASGIDLLDQQAMRNLFEQLFMEKEESFVRDELIRKGLFSEGNILSPQENKLRYEDVIGYHELKEEIRQQVEYVRADERERERYEAFGIQPKKGILLYGPPGNAKSMVAQATAGEYGFYFFKVLSKDFANTIPEEQIRKLERIFSETIRFSKMMTNIKGIVLFFDEIDSLAGIHVLSPVVRGSLLNYIADENEGIRSKKSKILFMAATNFKGQLDEAVQRSGRIDTHLEMDNPKESDGIEMLRRQFEKDDHVAAVDDALLKKAYQHLVKEAQEKFDAMYEIAELSENPTVLKRVEAQRKLQRPSGSDIVQCYQALKNRAFYANRFTEDRKLIIQED